MGIVVLGTVALDSVKTPFGKREQMLGGSAVHFSMSARLFTGVDLVAIIGEDFPQKHINFLKSRGVGLTSLIKGEGKTFAWAGEYHGDLNSARTLRTELGVLAAFRPRIAATQRGIRHLFLANVDPEIQEKLLHEMRRPRLVGLDSMNYWINTKKKALLKVLKQVDIFVANDQEARDLTGESNLICAARALAAKGPKMVLIKKGEHGVMFSLGDFFFALPAYPTGSVVDPTGAGDTFAGGFMGYLAAQRTISSSSIKKALAYGTVCASFNVEGFGTERTSQLTLRQVTQRLAEYKKCFMF